MKYHNTLTNGLRLKLPTGGTRLIGACEFHDDPYVIIEGNTLRRWHSADDWRRGDDPEKIEELPVGTEIRLWDEDEGHPLLGVVL